MSLEFHEKLVEDAIAELVFAESAETILPDSDRELTLEEVSCSSFLSDLED